MNADQYRNLPSWVNKWELCRVAGLNPNTIRMRLARCGELTESEQEALAEAAGMRESTLSSRIAGGRDLSVEESERLAEALKPLRIGGSHERH